MKKKSPIKKKTKDTWVVLLHGILRTPSSMKKIEHALNAKGYKTINFGYSSRNESVKQVTGRLHRKIKRTIGNEAERVHFVTHSFGTIIIRYYLAHNQMKRLGKFVMIAPPNKGSKLARILGKLPLYTWLLGSAGEKVKEVTTSLPHILKKPPCEFGIIAGGIGLPIGLNPLLKGDDDGTVTVEEAKLKGMKDFILLKGQHSSLLLQKSVINNVLSFLEKGIFLH